MVTLGILTIAFCMVSAGYGQLCNDIDPQACQLMAAQNPAICQDPKLSQSACPRFCNLCPLECYHCNETMTDMSNCTTTRACNPGEKCLLKQFRSSTESHEEYYVMECASLPICDGVEPVMVGRRGVQLRDMSLSCCSTDRCNNPSVTTTATMTTTQLPTTATPTCAKDLEILVEDGDHESLQGTQQILDFLKAVVRQLTIGDNDTLVGMATFDTHVENKFELKDHLDKASVQRAIDGVHFRHSTDTIDYDDVAEYLDDHFQGRNHNRPTFTDVILIITDTSKHGDMRHIRDFHVAAANKIVINLKMPSVFNALASNPNSILTTPPWGLMNYLNTVVSLICS